MTYATKSAHFSFRLQYSALRVVLRQRCELFDQFEIFRFTARILDEEIMIFNWNNLQTLKPTWRRCKFVYPDLQWTAVAASDVDPSHGHQICFPLAFIDSAIDGTF